jgi:hypothetical protein
MLVLYEVSKNFVATITNLAKNRRQSPAPRSKNLPTGATCPVTRRKKETDEISNDYSLILHSWKWLSVDHLRQIEL